MARGRSGGRPRCEHCPAIDVRDWRRRRFLEPSDGLPVLIWSRDGRSLCNVIASVAADRIVLEYTLESGRHRVERVDLVRTPCHYGGARAWFKCPGCSRRSGKLFLRQGRFLCRRCHGLGYASQLTARVERPRLIAQRIRRQLGQDPPSLFAPFPEKPDGMPQRTYDRLYAKGAHYERLSMVNLAAWVERSRARV